MRNFCVKCGKLVNDEEKVCPVCGNKLKINGNINKNNSNVSECKEDSTIDIYDQIFRIIALILIGALLFWRFAIPKIDLSWQVDAACLEVKSEVYDNYNEIPELDGEIIYKNEYDYIVVVRYILKDSGIKGSYACHIWGIREGSSHLSGMTTELPYDYDYSNDIEKLKATFKIK